MHKIIEQLKEGVDSLFKKINCDKSSVRDMLGGVAGVTEGNMMQYLGIIEQRTNELLQAHAYKNAKIQDPDRVDLSVAGLLGGGPQIAAGSIAIVPPTTCDDYETEGSTEESEDECRPLTAQELKNKIMKSINRREVQPRNSSPHSARSEEKTASKRKKK
ncbi:outer dynein arm protein 1-like [Xenia sp. Carnegie-2017]|uniref:outer dynein arm protein 1-like n=1 Tax=Xenia sp. Carnegie-2017 TaxID=2897299 RepID=UPI001F049CE6|nr:outer dynein arm protein 1-like [Xenia sp. Carnegie-2017]